MTQRGVAAPALHVDATGMCVCCGEGPPAHEGAYCGRCVWKVRAEFEEGFYELRAYLARWRRFRDWEAETS